MALALDPRPLRWLPLLSVPGVLGIRPDTMPADVPYLAAQPARIEAWRARLGDGHFQDRDQLGVRPLGQGPLYPPRHRARRFRRALRPARRANWSRCKKVRRPRRSARSHSRPDRDARHRPGRRCGFLSRYRRGDARARSDRHLRYLGRASGRALARPGSPRFPRLPTGAG